MPAAEPSSAPRVESSGRLGLGSAGSALDEIEEVLRAVLARAVRLDPARIDRERPMTFYGLDSLAAVELCNAAEAELGAAPSLTALLDGISLAEAARELAASSPPAAPALPETAEAAEPGGAALPLSFGQQALWILYGLAPASAAYHLAGAARLAGDVDLALLGRAFDRLVARHEALRTTYAVGGAGPVQRVHPAAAGVLACEEAAGWSAAELSRRVHEAAFRPFYLERGPVFRAVLFAREAEEPSVLVLAVHHIAADFWSLALLVGELRALYAGDGRGGEAALAAPALQPAELARRQRREQAAGRYDDLLASARGELAGAPPLDLPLDRPRPALQTWRGVQRGGRLGADVAAAAAALGRRHGATLFMVLLAGFEALLARYGGQEDFLVGTPTAGRSSGALEAVVGYLVNPVPVRADLAGDPDVRALVARARRAALAAMARQELPFALLAEGLGGERDPSRPAVFQAMVALQRSPRPELAGLAAFALGEGGARLPLGGGAVLASLALDPPGAQFDVLLLAAEIDGDLAAALQVNADLFDAATAERMLGHLASLLAAMAGGDDRRLSALPLLSPAEEQQLVREWNATATPRPAASLPELIAAQASRTPEAVAVSCGEAQLTYGELDHRAGRLARHLARCGVGPEVRVGICLERSLELILALVATLRAGGAFVPIDPSYPAERVAYMLSDARTAVVLTQEAVAARLPGHAARTVQVDRRGEWWGSPGRPAPALPPDGLAYVLYTSGSTGRPKGAMNGHRAIANRLRWMQRAFPLTAADRVLQKTPASFDVSVWEFFWPLTIGARLVVARPGGHLDPAYLRDEIVGEMVTIAHFVPSLLQLFLDQPGLAACDSVRRVIASGEALSPELAARFDATLGAAGTELHNLYGPAEAAVDVTWWPCRLDAPALPIAIGRPIDNTSIHVLDRRLRLLPIGAAGELCIGGVQVGRGYLGRPELTAERFLPDPFAEEAGARLYRTGDLVRRRPGGELEFLGRLDHQVKVRGVRIELGEVERALAAHGAVREAVVAARQDGGRLRLVAYVVPVGEAPAAMALRAHLQEMLPETSIPSAWVFLPALPLSPSGKVDRRALPVPELAVADAPFAMPRTPAEEALAAIWGAILERERIGIHDNFFALGGDSILGLQTLSRAAQAGLRLTLRELFRHPTIAELAPLARAAEGGAEAGEPLAGEVPLTPVQRDLFARELPRPHHWNWSAAGLAAVREPLAPGVLERALAAVARHHDAFRLRFVREEGGWRQLYAEDDAGAACARVDLRALASGAQPAALAAACAAVQASLDLARGPLLRAVLFELGGSRPDRLLVAVHHLVMDGVSWRIFGEDLEIAWRQAAAGEEVRLPPASSPFGTWARRLAAFAAGDLLLDEVAYWAAQGGEEEPLPVDFPRRDGAGRESSTRAVRRTLGAEESAALVAEVHAAYQTRVEDLLRAALMRALARWTGRRALRVDLEGYGRQELFSDLDLTRTVGWLTAVHPLRLDLGPARGPGEELKAIKEQGRRIPSGGVGYGVLRHLAAAELREAPAEVLFKYLGRADGGEGALFAWRAEPGGPALDPAGRRSHLLTVSCWLATGRLETEWGYSADLHRPETVERLAEGFLAELGELVAHCQEPGVGGYSPSDFPEAELSDRELEKLLGKLARDQQGALR